MDENVGLEMHGNSSTTFISALRLGILLSLNTLSHCNEQLTTCRVTDTCPKFCCAGRKTAGECCGIQADNSASPNLEFTHRTNDFLVIHPISTSNSSQVAISPPGDSNQCWSSILQIILLRRKIKAGKGGQVCPKGRASARQIRKEGIE